MSLLLLFMGRSQPGSYIPPVVDTTPAPRARTYYLPLKARTYAPERQDRIYNLSQSARTYTLSRQDRVYRVPVRRNTKDVT